MDSSSFIVVNLHFFFFNFSRISLLHCIFLWREPITVSIFQDAPDVCPDTVGVLVALPEHSVLLRHLPVHLVQHLPCLLSMFLEPAVLHAPGFVDNMLDDVPQDNHRKRQGAAQRFGHFQLALRLYEITFVLHFTQMSLYVLLAFWAQQSKRFFISFIYFLFMFLNNLDEFLAKNEKIHESLDTSWVFFIRIIIRVHHTVNNLFWSGIQSNIWNVVN